MIDMEEEAKRIREYRKEKSKDLEWKEQDKQRRKAYYEKKKKEDPDFFNKKMTAWRKEKVKKDPSWGARRQKEFRLKHPDKFNYMMARFYLRRLTSEKRAEVMNEVENERK
jgi:hypothetical protein